MAGVLEDLVLTVVAQPWHPHGPRSRERGRILNRELVVELVRTGPPELLRDLQLITCALKSAATREIGRLDDQRVAFPAAPRVTPVLSKSRSERRLPAD